MPIGNSSQLIELLAALDAELSVTSTRVHLAVIGGSALLAQGIISRPTRDVDIVALVVDHALSEAEPLPAALGTAARRVADNFGLENDWLNAEPTSLVREGSGLPAGMQGRLVRLYAGSHLIVDVAGRLDLIFFKVAAAADADRAAPRDITDLRALAPTADELTAAAGWARTHVMPGQFDDDLAAVLRAFGVDDQGRRDE